MITLCPGPWKMGLTSHFTLSVCRGIWKGHLFSVLSQFSLLWWKTCSACKGPSSLTILFLFCDKNHIGSLKQAIFLALSSYDEAQYFSQFLFLLWQKTSITLKRAFSCSLVPQAPVPHPLPQVRVPTLVATCLLNATNSSLYTLQPCFFTKHQYIPTRLPGVTRQIQSEKSPWWLLQNLRKADYGSQQL
jgi:hypothetical protein